MSKRIASEDGKHIKSIHKAFDIIETVEEQGGSTVSELAKELDYSKSTVHYYLRTLERGRFIVNDGDGYRLGLRFLDLGGAALSHREPPSFVREKIDKLSQETSSTAIFAVEELGYSVYTHVARPEDVDWTEPHVGFQQLLHSTAFGRAIFAYLSDDYQSRIIDRYGLPETEETTITNEQDLYAECERIRENKVAFSNETQDAGLQSIAAPIYNPETKSAYGAVGVYNEIENSEISRSQIKARRFADNPQNIVKRTAQLIRNKHFDTSED
jgi:DNA-binding IclR family transcriptional regulator